MKHYQMLPAFCRRHPLAGASEGLSVREPGRVRAHGVRSVRCVNLNPRSTMFLSVYPSLSLVDGQNKHKLNMQQEENVPGNPTPTACST